MKQNSLIFSFSPNGTTLIRCCAWCKTPVTKLNIATLLDIGQFDFEVSHGICDFHTKEQSKELDSFNSAKMSMSVIHHRQIKQNIPIDDFEYFASRG